jgi:DnaJ-class molecular chaperone
MSDENMEQNDFADDCDFCNGTGVGGEEGEACPYCWGTGKKQD